MAPPKWSEVVTSDKYQLLNEQEKGVVRQRYWDNVISQDRGYVSLPDPEKLKVQERFFGEVRPSLVERAFQQTKEFLWDQPAEGAEILREAGADAISPTPVQIEDRARMTGQVPYMRIAGRVAAETALEFIPMTPTEIGAEILGGTAIVKYGPRAAAFVAEKFPTLSRIMKSRISWSSFDEAMKARKVKPVAAAADVPEIPKPNPEAPIAPDAKPKAGAKPPVVPEGTPPSTTKAILEAGPKIDPIENEWVIGARPKLPEKDIFGQQLKKFNVSEDAQAIFDETSKLYKDKINQARRGVIDFEGTERMANDLGMSMEDLMKRRKGKAFNAEELEAAKGLAGRSLENVNAAKTAYLDNPTPQNLIELNANIARHAAVQQSFMGARAEAGRALSILRKATDPADIAKQNFNEVIEALGGQELTEEMAKRLASIDPKDVAGMNRFIRDAVKAKTADQVYEFWLNGILSSPLTHIRNVAGNTIFMLSKVPEKIFQGVVDKGVSIFTGRRTIYAEESVPELFGLFRGLADGTRRALHALKTGVPSTARKIELDRLPAIPGKAGEIVRTPTRALVAEDEFAKAIIGRSELSAQAYRFARKEGLKGGALTKRIAELEANPTDEIMEAVRKEQLLRTFQTRGGHMMRGLSEIRKIPGVRYLLPFLQTPTNIAVRGIERSPLGFIKAAHSIVTKKGQEEISKDLGNAMLGSAISSTVAYWALQGRITGAPPRDQAARDRFFRSGKLPYAIKIGDTWYSYAAFEPASMVIGATADAVRSAVEQNRSEDDPGFMTAAGAIVTAIPRYLVSRTYLSQVRDFIDAMSDPERYGNAVVERFAGSLVPASAFSRYIAYQMDPIIRDPQNFKEASMANIPGLSKKVQPKLTVFGEPATRPYGILSSVAIPSRKEIVSPIDAEDDELDRVSGYPGKVMGGIKLTGKEYFELAFRSGQKIKELRTELQSFPAWKELPANIREKEIGKIEKAARSEARISVYLDVLDRLPAGEKRDEFMRYGVESLGIPPGEVIGRSIREK